MISALYEFILNYSLFSELNAQLISALYEFMKSINDSQPMIAWLVFWIRYSSFHSN